MSELKLGDRVRVVGLEFAKDRQRGVLLAKVMVGYAAGNSRTHGIVGIPSEEVYNGNAKETNLYRHLTAIVELDQLVPDLEWDADQKAQAEVGTTAKEELTALFKVNQLAERMDRLEDQMVSLDPISAERHVKRITKLEEQLVEAREAHNSLAEHQQEHCEALEHDDERCIQLHKRVQVLEKAVLDKEEDESPERKAMSPEEKAEVDAVGDELVAKLEKLEQSVRGKGPADAFLALGVLAKYVEEARKKTDVIQAKYAQQRASAGKDSLGDTKSTDKQGNLAQWKGAARDQWKDVPVEDVPPTRLEHEGLVYVPTGEYRTPKKGEFFYAPDSAVESGWSQADQDMGYVKAAILILLGKAKK